MLQVVLAAVLSVAYGANSGQTTMGIVAMMHVIITSQAVPETATPGIGLHAIKTAAMLLGAISWGARLAPVTGTPCRRRKEKEKENTERREKTTPFGVNLMRSQVLYQAGPSYRYAMHPFLVVSIAFCTDLQ